MASTSTKKKMFARLTSPSATPARLIGLRNNMRSRCQGSTACGGDLSSFMLHLCGLFFLRRRWHRTLVLGGTFDFLLKNGGIQCVLLSIMVQRHFTVPPRPVHRIHIRVEEYLIEMPN